VIMVIAASQYPKGSSWATKGTGRKDQVLVLSSLRAMSS
jgi:hypothetical protein